MEVRAVLSVLSSTCFLQLRIVQGIDFVLVVFLRNRSKERTLQTGPTLGYNQEVKLSFALTRSDDADVPN
jgi:hypothetical protein